jgi:hypothetical protein
VKAGERAFIASFTDDAYLVDWGREFHGHDGVARWNETDKSASSHNSRCAVRVGTATSTS